LEDGREKKKVELISTIKQRPCTSDRLEDPHNRFGREKGRHLSGRSIEKHKGPFRSRQGRRPLLGMEEETSLGWGEGRGGALHRMEEGERERISVREKGNSLWSRRDARRGRALALKRGGGPQKRGGSRSARAQRNIGERWILTRRGKPHGKQRGRTWGGKRRGCSSRGEKDLTERCLDHGRKRRSKGGGTTAGRKRVLTKKKSIPSDGKNQFLLHILGGAYRLSREKEKTDPPHPYKGGKEKA